MIDSEHHCNDDWFRGNAGRLGHSVVIAWNRVEWLTSAV